MSCSSAREKRGIVAELWRLSDRRDWLLQLTLNNIQLFKLEKEVSSLLVKVMMILHMARSLDTRASPNIVNRMD